MPEQLLQFQIVILCIALLHLAFGISNSLIFFSLHIIYLGNIIRNNSSIGRLVLHYFKALQRLVVIMIPESNKAIIVVGIVIIGIVFYLPNGIEQRFGFGKLLCGKV